jgi:hypothetical protein
VLQQHKNANNPNTWNGIGSLISATSGANIHRNLAMILQKAKSDDLILAGKSSFEVMKVKL